MPRRSRQLDLFAVPHKLEEVPSVDGKFYQCVVCGQLSRFGKLSINCPSKWEAKKYAERKTNR
jgi:hypothetical protein